MGTFWSTTPTRLRVRFAALTLLFCLPAAVSGRGAKADTYTVTNLSDSGSGSLRQAILNANAHTGADTIVFASGVTGTLSPTTTLPVLSDDVEIDGPGANMLSISLIGQTTPFQLLAVNGSGGTGPNVTLSGLTFDRGRAVGGGGGLNNVNGSVTVRNCVFSNNQSDNFGGGIANAGVMVLTGCTLSGNIVNQSNANPLNYVGGGIYNTGDLTLTNCTLSQNTVLITEIKSGQSTARGAGIGNTGTLHVSHCTFGDNGAHLSYFINVGQSGLEPGQGGAIYNTGSLTIDDSILVANTDPIYGGTLANSGGTVVSQGYNLSNDGANGLLTAAGDQTSTATILAPLQDNGGPTPTQMPVAGSPAIDAGNPAFTPPPSTDQRGLARVIGPRIDIGAVEYRPPFDFDGDGHNDLLFQNSQTGQIVAWYMNGLTVQGGSGFNSTPSSGWKVGGSGDFNGDGYPDLVFQNTTTKQVVVWYMQGSTYLGGELLASPPSTATLVGVGDFNGDGRPDLVFEDSSGGGSMNLTVDFWFYKRATLIGQASIARAAGPVSANYHVVGVGDFNRDGELDLLFQNTVSGKLSVWYLNGNTYIGGSALAASPDSGWQVKAVADYNNDGSPDLVFQNASTGKVAIWFMNGIAFSDGNFTSSQPLANYQIVGPR